MARGKYQRRGQSSASPSTTTEYGPVTQVAPIEAALKGGTPIAEAATSIEFGTFAPADEISIMPAATEAAIEANKPKMVPMLLERNYVPLTDNYEIVGYNREPKTVKSAAGVMVVIDPGGFIQDIDEDTGKFMGMPPVLAGTGFANKLIAGTVVKLPVEEAKRVLAKKIGSRTLDD